MSLVPGFLQSIREDLEDDTSRLIFADWLEEQGEPRGELFRVQCQLASWVPDLEQRQQLLLREAQLQEQHGARWLGPLEKRVLACKLHRGMWHLTMDARRFLAKVFAKDAEALLDEAMVEKLHLTTRGTMPVEALAKARHLQAVPALDLSGCEMDDQGLAKLVASPWLEHLTHLHLNNNHITDAGLLPLVTSSLFPRLRWLDLRNNQLKNRGIQRLLKAATPRLAYLGLHGNEMSRDTIQDLVAWREQKVPAGEKNPARLTNSIGMELLLIPAGKFLMGAAADDSAKRRDESPQHAVTISKPFYLAAFQVTQRQYEIVMGTNPARFNRKRRGGPDNPVENVSWPEAQEFCERLSAMPGEAKGGRVYRLPTEAEWEYACRAGTTSPFHHGQLPHASLMNYDGNHVYGSVANGPYLERTAIVGSYAPNAFGLYDMHGNVWEWCADWYSASCYRKRGRKDPRGPARGTSRVIRGGCWDCIGAFCRAAHRHGDPPETRDNFNGFRAAMTLS